MEVLAGEFEEVKRSVLLQMKKKKKKEKRWPAKREKKDGVKMSGGGLLG